MPSDIEIAQSTPLQPIADIAQRLGLPAQALVPYGHHKAKITLSHLRGLESRPNGRLVLVTGINPTPAGEGKTTTTVGLGDALNRIGQRTIVCLREPSLGPVFGLKGGAAGGGRAQVVPMEDINLHFTGDFQAIALAHNLLSALIDNHIHHGNALRIDARRVSWKRVVDMNDRALREIVVGMGGPGNGYPRQDGFDIVVASEIMAILCLATSLSDLKSRLSRIVVASSLEGQPITAQDLQATGAMTALLRDAMAPNLVQTLEHNPAFIHGGPFANIAHGCNSVMATRSALKLADWVVTEAGFGADLGAEKFLNIKCRKSGLWPSAAVLVASVRALKYQGGADVKQLSKEDLPRLAAGLASLERHIQNVSQVYGLPCVVALNHFVHDTDAEVALVRERVAGTPMVVARHWAEGGAGAQELAQAVVQCASAPDPTPHFLYPDSATLWDKAETVARRVHRAKGLAASSKVRAHLQKLQDQGYGHLPVCIAKTPYSWGTDPKQLGALEGHEIDVREVRLAAGAEFVVLICGAIMPMPGLPAQPAAASIDVDEDGRIIGLF
ncbi:MAG: formate--tetrahydrofolate ligase [Betaproteobacteria bacterium]|nr:formate--tetrahydrofolate ligase [Betaproteobacteria bacterium]